MGLTAGLRVWSAGGGGGSSVVAVGGERPRTRSFIAAPRFKLPPKTSFPPLVHSHVARDTTLESLLEAFCHAKEFEGFTVVRREDKKVGGRPTAHEWSSTQHALRSCVERCTVMLVH